MYRDWPIPSVKLDPPPGWPPSFLGADDPVSSWANPSGHVTYMNPSMDPNASLADRLAQAKKERDYFDQRQARMIAGKEAAFSKLPSSNPFEQRPPIYYGGETKDFYMRALNDLLRQAKAKGGKGYKSFVRSLDPLAQQLQQSDKADLQQQIDVLQGKLRF